ncbi:MAG: SPFH domain-containing protein [Thermodesulfobacteriota bacterium]
MLSVIIAIVLVILGILVLQLMPSKLKPGMEEKKKTRHLPLVRRLLGGGMLLAAGYLVLSTSFVIIDADKVGHLKRIYLGKSMDPGQIIAFEGQKGPQARILPPGFHFKFLLNVFFEVEELEVFSVAEGQYGFLVARDGKPLRGRYLADAWPEDKFQNMLDATFFLKNGGQKGPQLSILPPGTYRLNRYLFEIKSGKATDVPAGFVGVVKSNIQETPQLELAEIPSELAGSLSVPLVKKGSVGIWNQPLQPGRYYLNAVAYNVTLVDTRVQTWSYEGGYTQRFIDLKVTQDGQITQSERSLAIAVPDNAADSAIFTRMEGWLVPQELRIQVQVEPRDAPFLVASVGNVESAENKIVTPSIRSVVRNICAAEKVLSMIDEHRTEVEQRIEESVIPEGKKAGVSIKDVRIADTAVPPELLTARLREQLAEQLRDTFLKEQIAQNQRIATEKARAEANQQSELVAAEIRVKIAERDKEAAKLKGEGEKLKLTEIALGQGAQVGVLGEERVTQLAVLDKILRAAVENPKIVKIPNILVSGENGGLEGAAAILGASNLVQGLKEQTGGQAKNNNQTNR